MSKITKATTYTMPHGRTIEIPAGLRVIPAHNLSEDSQIKYWLHQLTPEMRADTEIESHYRNYGFGLTQEEVELKDRQITFHEAMRKLADKGLIKRELVAHII